jgi:hypothetical protein
MSINTPVLDSCFGSPGTTQKIDVTVADAHVHFTGNVVYCLLPTVNMFIAIGRAAAIDGSTPFLMGGAPVFFALGAADGELHAICTAATVSGTLYVTAMTGVPIPA